MKSVMSHSFSYAPQIDAPRSKFDRSFAHKTTFDAGWLIPFYWDEVLPGDTFNVNATIFARLATPLHPIMDNMYLDTQFFFVPYRQIWNNFRKFCGEQVDPSDSIDFQIPVLNINQTVDQDVLYTTALEQWNALCVYLGIPNGLNPSVTDVSALPFRAYSHIYNEWFRDQNLIDSLETQLGDGPDPAGTSYVNAKLMRRGKRHDYFTSALPWPQKGDAVTLPLGSTAPVTGLGIYSHSTVGGRTNVRETDYQTTTTLKNYTRGTDISTTSDTWMKWTDDGLTPDVNVDLSAATAATINDLREAFQVQKLLERDARGGTRYSELVRNHFGVDFYDVTYRPEYLGGGSTPVNVNPVADTANTVGDLGAFGTASAHGHGFSKSFVEHGLVMGILSVRADLTYQQGLQRAFSRSTRYDFYWPSLAHLGEQEILNKEIYTQGTSADEDVFGYQERYAEYRYKPSMITALFNSTATGTLDPWHLSQEFASLPTLGQTFIEEDPPIDRVVAVPSEPHFIMDSYIRQICARPMPVFGVPGMIDHF